MGGKTGMVSWQQGVAWVVVLGLVGPAWAWRGQVRELPAVPLRLPPPQLFIGPRFEKARPFREGLAAVQHNGQWGFINRQGNWVIPPQFAQVWDFREGLAPAAQGSQWGFIDRQGNWVIPPQFSRVHGFSGGRATVWLGERAGVVTATGALVIPPQRFWAIGEFRQGRAAAMDRSGRWGFIDPEGNWLIPPRFSSAGSFSEGLAVVALEGKRGYVNLAGELVIPPQFDSALAFSHGLGLVSLNGKWGFVDRTGQIAIPLRYDQAFSFAEGLAAVEEGGRLFYINAAGDPVLESPLNLGLGAALNFSDQLAPVAILGQTEKWGYMDRSGQLVIPPHFERVTFFSEGLAAVAIGDRWGYVAKGGHQEADPAGLE